MGYTFSLPALKQNSTFYKPPAGGFPAKASNGASAPVNHAPGYKSGQKETYERPTAFHRGCLFRPHHRVFPSRVPCECAMNIDEIAACEGFLCQSCDRKCSLGYPPRSREMELAREYKALERKYTALVAVQSQELPLVFDLLQKLEIFAETGCQDFDREERGHVAGVLAILREKYDDEVQKVRGESDLEQWR